MIKVKDIISIKGMYYVVNFNGLYGYYLVRNFPCPENTRFCSKCIYFGYVGAKESCESPYFNNLKDLNDWIKEYKEGRDEEVKES